MFFIYSLLLQAQSGTSPSTVDVIANGLLDKGPLVAALIIAVRWLVKRDQKRDEKLDKYILEDRQKMIETIQNNTHAMNEMSRVMEEKKEVDKELMEMIRQSINNTKYQT
jgi:hypothetical protein